MAEKRVVVQCDDLCFRYGKPWVLEEVSFEVTEGESLCVIGPNGGGKSTLLKLLLGLLDPGRGALRIFGESCEKARSRIGYVPQSMQFDRMFPISALDIVLMGRLDRLRVGRFSKECRSVAMESLDEVGLADIAHRPFSDLSGGQRQRVMIARALA